MSNPDAIFFTTPRLTVRRFRDSDHVAFQAYRSDLEVARYQSWESCTEDEAIDYVTYMKTAPCGEPGQGFQFAVELTETGELIGDCYFKRNTDEPRQAEIGFTLAREFQGKGFATEAVSHLLDYAFETFGLHRVIAIADVENTASVALLERLGLRREGHFLKNIWFKGKWGDEFLYATLAEEWQTRRSSIAPPIG